MTYLIIFILISLSALFSGLTLGFFSLNRDDIKRKADLGNKDAKALYSVRKKGYLLLSTLLIGNVAVNSVLSIFLGSITNGLSAWVISIVLIVLFGEIAPQAVFSRHALTLGVKFVPIIKFFIIIFYPICAPLSWMLYKMLGKEQDKIYSKQEFVKIIEAHEDSKFSDIDEDEEKLVRGALSFSDKKVSKIMTPIKDAVMLNGDNLFDENTIRVISSFGHSRIPVFKRSKHNIVGLLYVKDLVVKEEGKSLILEDVMRPGVLSVEYNTHLDDLLNSFKKSRKHLYVVRDKKGKPVGIVTVEDVLEEIIGDEIVDEYD